MRKLLRKLIIIMNKLLKIVLGLTLALALVVGVGAVRASAAGLGDSGAEVSALQADLISLGYSIQAGDTGWYGEQTAAAVSAFQAAYASEILAPLGLTAPTGFAGTLTMAKIAALKAGGSPVVGTFPAGCSSSAGFSSTTGLPCSTVVTYPAGCTSSAGFSSTTGLPCSTVTTLPAGCTSTDGFSTTTGLPCSTTTTTLPTGCTSTSGFSPTTGQPCTVTAPTVVSGAGSVDSYALTASINNEEVGEGVNDTAVMGLEIDASSNSDLTISAVKLVFLEGTATSNFDNYAKDVSIWLGTTEVGRVSSSVFTDDNDWTNTLSLSNAKVSAGTTGILYVKASGVTNIDTADAGDTWTADITS